MDRENLKLQMRRVFSLRSQLLNTYPFFGRLLMRLSIGFAECKTAYTDMRRIVFDPDFAARLSDAQLSFVLLHEVMHCVLKHCTRGKGKIHILYNIACDIVVNSIILEAINLADIEIDGCKAMHIAPNGQEGRYLSADEIYEMLIKKADKEIADEFSDCFDLHDVWDEVGKEGGSLLESLWDEFAKNSAKQSGKASGIPLSMERHLTEIFHRPKIDWRQILRDFIKFDKSDYMFSPPDRRFSGDFLMPSFCNDVYGSKIENLWYVVDTSGSVSNEAVTEAFEEIKDAIIQIENMQGLISFFDADITIPISFETVNDLDKISPVGYGGTDFEVIFKNIDAFFPEDKPTAIIIITDGYATFPKEAAAKDIPVIWLIIDSDVEPPWGEVLRIYTE